MTPGTLSVFAYLRFVHAKGRNAVVGEPREEDWDRKAGEKCLAQEIDNIVRVCNELPRAAAEGAVALTADRFCAFNRQVLEGLKVEADVVPGEIRRDSVTVGRYLGAPAEDCRYLLERLCAWLEGADFTPQPGLELVHAILKAIVAHVYLAWIHPHSGTGMAAPRG